MTRLFLHLLNVAAAFKIWSFGKKDSYLKYESTHFLILAIDLAYIWSASDQVLLLHVNHIAHYRPHLHSLLL